MYRGNTQQYYAHNGSESQSPPRVTQPEIVNAAPQEAPPGNQPPQYQYASYVHQRYYALQQHLAQQRQYAAYWQTVARQRQQSQFSQYYQHTPQQYGSGSYPAMQQAMHMNQMNTNHNHLNPNYAHAHERAPNGPIILSCEEQPALIASERNRYKKRKRRKRNKAESEDDETSFAENETVSIDIIDDDILGLDKDAFDKHTLMNREEVLPDINEEFDEWLCFTKQLWKRQRKYKNSVVQNSKSNQISTPKKKKEKDVMDLTESSLSISVESSPARDTLQIRSRFLRDRVRMTHKHKSVLKNKKVVNIMIKMGLVPPWNQMIKYDKWKKCYRDMFD